MSALHPKADMCSALGHVRSTPKSGHVRRKKGCPLSAINGHSQIASAKRETTLRRSLKCRVTPSRSSSCPDYAALDF